MNGILNSGLARGISLVSALALMILVTVLPRGLAAPDGSPVSHGLLALIMWGMSAGFVYGIGFVPRNVVLRMAFGPIAAWLGMGAGVVFYIQYFFR